jgi:hypothetical protein
VNADGQQTVRQREAWHTPNPGRRHLTVIPRPVQWAHGANDAHQADDAHGANDRVWQAQDEDARAPVQARAKNHGK